MATRDGLASSYERIVEKVDRERWTSIMRSTEPSILRADVDGVPHRYCRAGDLVVRFFVRDVNRANPESLDEAVLFVPRDVNGGLRVVAHFADF